MFEINFPFACEVEHNGKRSKLVAGQPLKVDRKDLNLFYGSAGMSVRALDKDGAPVCPWLNGPSCIEDAIAIADGDKE
jgi:hypothetical protein